MPRSVSRAQKTQRIGDARRVPSVAGRVKRGGGGGVKMRRWSRWERGGEGVRGGCFAKISRPSLKYRGRTVNLALSASAWRLGINHLGRQIRVQSNNSHRAQKQREKVSRIYYPFGGSPSPLALAVDFPPRPPPTPSPAPFSSRPRALIVCIRTSGRPDSRLPLFLYGSPLQFVSK